MVMVRTLPPQEAAILSAAYGLAGDGAVLSYRALAQQFGVSPERIQQREARAIQRLMHRYGPHFCRAFTAVSSRRRGALACVSGQAG